MSRKSAILSLVLAPVMWFGCAAKYSSPQTPQSALTMSDLDRVVIRSGSLDLRAKGLEGLKEEIDRIVEDVEGWVENWSLTDDRWLRMTVRVPAAELDTTMDGVATLAKVIHRSLRSLDVTEELIDLEVRLENLKALRDRLRAYLEQAKDLEEILEVEKELTRVQTEIESIEAKLKVLRGKVEMSNLDITVKRRGWF